VFQAVNVRAAELARKRDEVLGKIIAAEILKGLPKVFKFK
jgi:hypothetical protein